MGILITVSIGGGSLVLAAIIAWDLAWGRTSESSHVGDELLVGHLEGRQRPIHGLAPAVGHRPARGRRRSPRNASVAPGTRCLMSPLEAGEIVRAKVWGSMHALRFMMAAMVVAWTLGVITGAVSVRDYTVWITDNALMGILMAAVGVRLSLALPTATEP